MIRPLGPQKVSSVLALPDIAQPFLCTTPMAKETEQGQIVEVGPAPGFPLDDVVDVGEGHVGTTREATPPVPPHHLSTLGIARETSCPALVHGVPEVVVEGHHNGGVTGDPPHRLSVDQATMPELAGQAVGFA